MNKKICKNGHSYKGEKCPYCPDGGRPGKPHKTRLFGTTIRETIDVLKPVRISVTADKTAKRDRKIIFTRVAISTIVLVAAVIFAVTEEQRGTGIGLFGTVIGYWLK
jgi:hypothetical protein